MDLLTRTELQINQAENELLEEVKSNHEDLSIRFHGQSLSDRDAYTSADNFEAIKERLSSDGVVTRLQNLLRARVELL